MTGTKSGVLFAWGLFIHLLWLMGLWKLGGMFFRKKGKIAGCAICFFGLLTVLGICQSGNYLLGAVMKQMLLIVFFYLAFCGDGVKKLGFSSVVVCVWEFAWNGTGAALSICSILLSQNPWKPYERGSEYWTLVLSVVITAVCVYLLFCKTKLAEGHFLEGSGTMLFGVSCLLLFLMDVCCFGITQGVVMVSDGTGAAFWDTTYNEILTHMEVFVLSALCMTICLSLVFGMNRLIGYLTMDRLHKMEISRYQELLEQYKNQTNVRHDMKNHLISLSALAEYKEWDKLGDYLRRLCKAGMIGEAEIETGNRVVNAIVNTKRQIAGRKQITFECAITILKPLMIDEYDLCILWGNLLDNAIKAAQESKERYIFVQAEIVKRNFIMNVKNAVSPDMEEKGFGRKDWGTGLHNVERIVQKENGIMEIAVSGAVFEVSIMLPVVCCHDAEYDRK